jgi:hypothetical protein
MGKWFNHEMFVMVNNGKVVNYHLNKDVVDVTNNCSYHRVSFPIDKWKYDDMRIPKSVKEVGSPTIGCDYSSGNTVDGFFIAFEVPDTVNVSEEAERIYGWVRNHRGFW